MASKIDDALSLMNKIATVERFKHLDATQKAAIISGLQKHLDELVGQIALPLAPTGLEEVKPPPAGKKPA
ncbi:MAG: hypothetical protein [Arizlama microvirus]|nr:MAG: hypothetical protein [Arizlama microvirus]